MQYLVLQTYLEIFNILEASFLGLFLGISK